MLSTPPCMDPEQKPSSMHGSKITLQDMDPKKKIKSCCPCMEPKNQSKTIYAARHGSKHNIEMDPKTVQRMEKSKSQNPARDSKSITLLGGPGEYRSKIEIILHPSPSEILQVQSEHEGLWNSAILRLVPFIDELSARLPGFLARFRRDLDALLALTDALLVI